MFGCYRRPEIASSIQELELCAVMTCKMSSVLRTKLLSSRRAVTASDAEQSVLYFFHKI